MKILKPGKVEMRKFVCPSCGCIFIASDADLEHDSYGKWAICPQEGCERNFVVHPDDGEPYEEPTQSDEVRLAELIYSSNAVTSTTALKLSPWLVANGVTFREV